jgi:PRC-barrel domain.
MTHYTSDSPYQPKGDHNRRLSLGLDPDQFAAEAGITTEELRDYERTSPDHDYDPSVALRISLALDRLEREMPNLQNGRDDVPGHATLDHSRHQALMEHELVPEVLEGATIYGVDNSEIGKVSHVHGDGPSGQVVIDVGGFLGIGAKPVAVSMASLDFMRDENGRVHAVTLWTKADLERMPEHHHHH